MPIEPQGGSQEPPIFSDVDVRSALAHVALESFDGVPLIEETLDPVAVHTSFGQEYVTLPRATWIETCQRALGNQIRADRLQDQVDGLKLQIAAHEHSGAAKDSEMDTLDGTISKLEARVTKATAKVAVLRSEHDQWRHVAILLGVALIGCVGVMAWRLW